VAACADSNDLRSCFSGLVTSSSASCGWIMLFDPSLLLGYQALLEILRLRMTSAEDVNAVLANRIPRVVGGVGSTTGSLVNTAGSVGGAAASTAAGAGAGASSSLNSNSRGVVELRGLNLASSASSSNSGMFTSQHSNVHLDSGTQMILSVRSAK
jgi:hypothetical protein